MRILFIDVSLLGHRKNYLKALCEQYPNSVLLLPQKLEETNRLQYLDKFNYGQKRDLIHYLSWIKEIKKIVNKDKIDIVHFLCGDSMYRFFGIFLGGIKAKKIVTYHHMQFSRIRIISLKKIFSKSYGIVHTDSLNDRLNTIGITNVKKIEYPVFNHLTCIDNKTAKDRLGFKDNIPCIVVLGGTQRYKGIDILLDALKNVNKPFQLYITGKERDYSKQYIIEQTHSYRDSVFINLNRLSDEDYVLALSAADLLVLPYRKEFDGASGPMIEAIWNRKYIIGANHGSMGRIITEKDLGDTFETENASDLARVLNMRLNNIPKWSAKAEEFREELTIDKFLFRYDNVYNQL